MRLIDADALLTDRRKRMYYHLPNGDTAIPIIDIEHAPTVEERKTGEWINVTNDESLEEEYECSVCGYELFYSNPTNYCPNCGAKMEGNT